MGQLLREVAKASGNYSENLKPKNSLRRAQAGKNAGLKESQAAEAIAMSRVPKKKRIREL